MRPIGNMFEDVYKRQLLPGGGQEMGLRSGTEATAQIAGFAKAVELRCDHLEEMCIRDSRGPVL